MKGFEHPPKIVIVGGGAGGLELATRLGKRLGKRGLADITLVDQNRVHLWKPLLHEVVAGSLDTGMEALSYRAHSAENHYYYRMGSMIGLDKTNKHITLAPLLDHHGKQVLASRQIDYDILVMAIGARSNDFGMAGVREHCFTLDSSQEAEDFHLTFLTASSNFLKKPLPKKPPLTRFTLPSSAAVRLVWSWPPSFIMRLID